MIRRGKPQQKDVRHVKFCREQNTKIMDVETWHIYYEGDVKVKEILNG
jgi:hypothetical protein